MAVSNFTPTLDGWVGRINANEASFAALRSGAGNDVNEVSTSLILLMGSNASSNWDDMRRSVILFAISAGITPSELVMAGSLTLDPTVLPTDDFGGQAITVVETSPASESGLVVADYNLANFTMGVPFSAPVLLSGITTAPFTIDLNLAGRQYLQSVVAAGGTAKLGLVYEADRANSPPTAGVNLQANLTLDSADTAVGTVPVLAVTHQPGGGVGVVSEQLAYELAQTCAGLPLSAFRQQSLELSLTRLLFCLQGRSAPPVGQSVEVSLDGIFAVLNVARPRRATLAAQLRVIEANLP